MTSQEMTQAQLELKECIAEGFLWLDKDTNEVCEEEPNHENKAYLPDFIVPEKVN